MGYAHGVENGMYMEGDIHKVESRIYTRSEKWDTHGAESEVYTELKVD